HVRAAADATVDVNLAASIDGLHHLRQHLDGARRGVELTAAVVGDDDGGGAVLEGKTRIFAGHDALYDDRQASEGAEPVQVTPAQRRVEETGHVARQTGGAGLPL